MSDVYQISSKSSKSKDKIITTRSSSKKEVEKYTTVSEIRQNNIQDIDLGDKIFKKIKIEKKLDNKEIKPYISMQHRPKDIETLKLLHNAASNPDFLYFIYYFFVVKF